MAFIHDICGAKCSEIDVMCVPIEGDGTPKEVILKRLGDDCFMGDKFIPNRSLMNLDQANNYEGSGLESLTIASFCLIGGVQKEVGILDAPKIKDYYYVNLMDLGKNNVLDVALGSTLYFGTQRTKMQGNWRKFKVAMPTQQVSPGLRMPGICVHGYGDPRVQNHLRLWKYLSMAKVGEINDHERRFSGLAITQSSDGLTVVPAGEDETLRFR
ncbi:PREDICTED: uncharacterized protein LOC105110280 [Populus euphratica]|uniref:Uncharacterized protein LOC105110280 n=1 Tax=Populus euphratica TaxID=75702 RepID=A0AAJ6X2Q9_POPEU|nr:PREDICTED: uncharacterized protein LOC105110280 [Populus euphratica]